MQSLLHHTRSVARLPLLLRGTPKYAGILGVQPNVYFSNIFTPPPVDRSKSEYFYAPHAKPSSRVKGLPVARRRLPNAKYLVNTQKRVVIIGRPNVGKSTLFNFLTAGRGRTPAITHRMPGLTRDVKEGRAQLSDLGFIAVDTAGMDFPLNQSEENMGPPGEKTTRPGSTGQQETDKMKTQGGSGKGTPVRELRRGEDDGGVVDEMRGSHGSLLSNMVAQTRRAIAMADVILFVTDAKEGLTQLDEIIAAELMDFQRTSPHVPIILIANKCDGKSSSYSDGVMDTYGLGFGSPIQLTVTQNAGFEDLHAALAPHFPDPSDVASQLPPAFKVSSAEKTEELDASARADKVLATMANVDDDRTLDNSLRDSRRSDVDIDVDDADSDTEAVIDRIHDEVLGREDEQRKSQRGRSDVDADVANDDVSSLPLDVTSQIRLAVVGRPNVGKSTLVNALVGFDRVLVGPTPGLTRDSIEIEWKSDENDVLLVDTAGLRRKTRVHDELDKAFMRSSITALKRANVILLVVDASVPVTQYEVNLARKAAEEGKPLVIVANKWDLVSIPQRQSVLEQLKFRQAAVRDVGEVPIVTVSALKRTAVDKIMPRVSQLFERWARSISASELNTWLKHVVGQRTVPRKGTKQIKLRYITQVSWRPPRFVIFTNISDDLPPTYLAYLKRRLREDFDLEGIPIRFIVRSRENYLQRKNAKQKRSRKPNAKDNEDETAGSRENNELAT